LPEWVSFDVFTRILEDLGYHRSAGSHIFVSEGRVPGPKALAVELLDSDLPISLSALHQWLLDVGVDPDAVEAGLADFPLD
jgi:hypothetical protein